VAAVEQTYERKLRELQYALAYEQQYSKKKILQSYLNIAYFGSGAGGGGAYGVQEAAQQYFSVDADELNLLQSALIAGLVKNPSAYDPTRFPDAAIERRNTVLARMAELGLIRQRVAERSFGLGLGLKPNPRPNGCVSTKAPFFCLYVQNYLLQEPSLGETPAERQETLNEGGLTITTTLDLRAQRAIDNAVSATVDKGDNAIGSMAMVEPGTGEVRAIGQSRPMGNDQEAGETYLNYSVPKGVRERQRLPARIDHEALRRRSSAGAGAASDHQLHRGGAVPAAQRHDVRGLRRQLLARSAQRRELNRRQRLLQHDRGHAPVDQRLLHEARAGDGHLRAATLARKMGLNILETQEVPTFALGVSDVSPLDMAGAYATFAARGIFCSPHPVTSVVDFDGELLATYTGDCKRLLKVETADTINAILRGVQEFGGFGAGNALDVPSAAKTGTSQYERTVWYVGYTPTLSAAATVAGVSPQGKPRSLSYSTIGGRYITPDLASGSGFAGPMWAQAMRAVPHLTPDRDFVAPSGGLGSGDSQLPFPTFD
jgi:membrane peptidoglycan carboxypeptidase